MLYRVLLIITLAATGCLGGAHPSAQKLSRRNYRSNLPPHVKPTTKCDISTQAQQEELVTLISEAQQILNDVAPDLKETSPAFLAFMSTKKSDDPGFHSRVQFRLEQMAEIATEKQPLILDCPFQTKCTGKTAFAYRDDDGKRVIALCPELLNKKNTKGFRNFGDMVKEDANICDDTVPAWKRMERLGKIKAGIFIHELAHLGWGEVVPGTTDCVYGSFWSNYLARNIPSAAANNADNYMYLTTSEYLNKYCANRKKTKSPAGQDIYAFEVKPVFQSSFQLPPGGITLGNGVRVRPGLNRFASSATSPSGEPWTAEPNMQPMGLLDEDGMSGICRGDPEKFKKLNSRLPEKREDINKSMLAVLENGGVF